MAKKIVLVSTDRGSRSVKALANQMSQDLGYKVWRVPESRVRGRRSFNLRSQGTPKNVQLNAFRNAGISCPDFTNDINQARTWIAEGNVVICRRLLNSYSGKGIVVAETADQLVTAPLYTKYVKKKSEYRVHVVNGQVIDVQIKRKRRDFNQDDRNTRIRNLENGYIFAREGINEPQGIRELAVNACRAINYNLGAVDIVHNERNNLLCVLEVNARPGLQGQTVQNYSRAIIRSL